jgi:L-threonylcarbamoyladenylate synthase
VVLVEGEADAVRRALREMKSAGSVGVLLPEGWRLGDETVVVQRWAAWERPEELAARLYAALRALDAMGVDVIVCPLPPEGALSDAIRDRLMKAARGEEQMLDRRF